MNADHLPPPLMVSEEGSFAEHTIVQRKPQIIRDLLRHNPYPPSAARNLGRFADEIARGTVQPLSENAPDVSLWHEHWVGWEGRLWRELPWYFAETYFYRRVLEIVGYFQPGPFRQLDPFGAQKGVILGQGIEDLTFLVHALPPSLGLAERFDLWLLRSLWGNRADLSNRQVISDARQVGADDPRELLLVDHRARVWDLFAKGRVRRLDWVADNSGLELLSDLTLLHLLLGNGLVQSVHLHLKPQPFFVSDAMPQDLEMTLQALRQADSPALQNLGEGLHAQRVAGRMVVHDDAFWATCLFFSQFPEELAGSLARSDLVVFKGDVNYRRLLEDRHWPAETDLVAITGYMPASFLALRTLKGELIVGLPTGRAEELSRQDPEWLVNGRRGLVHLVERSALRG